MRYIFFLVLFSCQNIFFAQTLNYYFGNLHSHTAFSDGNKDSASSGIFRPDASYAYAKLSNDFDFLGISEHNHYSSNKNPGFKLPRYQTGLNMADAANQDNDFLTLFGMEYGVSSNYNGHVIIYGFNQLIGWENSVPGVTGNNYDIYNAKSNYDSLFLKIKNNPNAFCYLAHPDFDQYSSHGTSADPLAFAPYNAMYDSAIVGVPLRSGLATSAAQTYDDYSQGNYFTYFKRLLYVGYHIGIGYDHDNHYTNFGRGNGGRLVILAPSLTRPNLVAAMQKMNFYGSDDSNAKIDFNLGGKIMGSIVKGNKYPTFNLTHADPDGEKADTIKIWKGHKGSGGLWAEIVHTTINSDVSTFYDNNIQSGIEYYYFAEIKQKDNQWIVTSPIWYTADATLEVTEQSQGTLNLFPNPAADHLELSFSNCDDYQIIISEISGRNVYSANFFDSSYKLNLSGLKPGVYILQITGTKKSFTRKVMIDR